MPVNKHGVAAQPIKPITFTYILDIFDLTFHRDTASSITMVLQEDFVIKPKNDQKPSAVVIFLHGLGDTGEGWRGIFGEHQNQNVRYIFPNSATRRVTLNGGARMPAWFDLKSLDGSNEDAAGIKEAANEVRELIAEQMRKFELPSNKIFIGGFSMGGALALYTSLTHKEPLGGVVALSSWLPMHKSFLNPSDSEHSLNCQSCDILQGHGSMDVLVPLSFGKATNTVLKGGRGKNSVNMFKEYAGMSHSSCDQELCDVKNFIDNCLKK